MNKIIDEFDKIQYDLTRKIKLEDDFHKENILLIAGIDLAY
ncbi:hypothetical protein [Paenibacillus pabuli]